MRELSSRSPRALAIALSVALSGCTAVGFGVGTLVDHKRPPKAKPVARSEVDTLVVGEAIELQLWDGTRLSGKYQGLQWERADAYAPRYEAARAKLAPDAAVPALGPGARVVVTSGGTATGEFLGLGAGVVRFVERGAEVSIRLDRVLTLADAAGRSVSGAALAELVAARRLPTLAALTIEGKAGNRAVDYADVAGVSRLQRSNSGKLVGTLLGLAVDVAAVAILASDDSWDNSDSSCLNSSQPCASCPLFYSFDGSRYVLDAEPLGGAIFAAAQRTDVARLDHVAEAGGRYRLQLRNEQAEIDHVDAVALRVVDHAEGVEIVPDAAGRHYALRATHAPLAGRVASSAASDRRSGGVAALVAAADGEAWVSDWWGHDTAAEREPRDGVELEFPRPRTAVTALLVARVGATAMAPRVLNEVLALHGRELGRFYASLEGEPLAREAFERAREREVLPTVRVFDGSAWRVAGHLRDLPSLVRREQALPLDLRGVAGDVLRIRIDGPPGFFAIDRAVVAYDAEPALLETRRLPVRAREDSGRDVLWLLRDADGRRHSLRPHLDGVTLEFEAPPRRPGLARTVLVEATGYYNVIVHAEGEPQREAFRRLLTEPGAVARFALDRMHERGRVAAKGPEE
jgi:hypothetical protein